MATTTAPITGNRCSCVDPLFFDVDEVARILGVSRKSVEKLLSTGDLESTLVLTRRKVYRSSVAAYLKRAQSAHRAATG